MSEPSKELERLVVTKALRHGDNPVARWCASNAVIRRDCNANYMPDKAKATGKIDAIVAAIIAISRSILYQDTTSIYETRGMREV
jgi:phage terminase large subunit-like protein